MLYRPRGYCRRWIGDDGVSLILQTSCPPPLLRFTLRSVARAPGMSVRTLPGCPKCHRWQHHQEETYQVKLGQGGEPCLLTICSRLDSTTQPHTRSVRCAAVGPPYRHRRWMVRWAHALRHPVCMSCLPDNRAVTGGHPAPQPPGTLERLVLMWRGGRAG